MSRPFRPFIRISVCLLITTAIYCCAFAVSTASAATYYVDDTNGNDACDGSVAQPWKTLSKTQSTVTSGDTAYFRNGSYGVWSAVNVTNTNWITYKAAAGHTPVLSKISINNSVACNSYLVFDGFKMVSGQNKGVWAKNVRYLQLKNLDVSGSVDIMAQDITTHQYPGIKLENGGASADAVIENCTVHSDSSSKRMGYTSGIEAYGSANVSISGCDVSGSGYGIFVYGDGISVKDNRVHDIISDGIMVYECNNLLIENNIIHGLDVYRPTLAETPTDTTWSADGKTMTNPNAKWNTAGGTLITTHMKLQLSSGNNAKANINSGDNYVVSSVISDTQIVLANSIMSDPNGVAPSNVNYNILSTVHSDLMQIVSQVDHSGITIRGNQLYDQERTGNGDLWWFNVEGVGGRNYLIENNLLWNIYTDEFDERRSYAQVGNIHGLVFRNNTIIGRVNFNNDSDVEVYNNIMSFVYFYSTTGLTKNDYNIVNRLYYDAGYPPIDGGHNTVLHPYSLAGWNDPVFTSIFANFANGDYRYASSNSLGVGHGDPANYPATDILGNSRDSSPDAGCYEYINHAPVLGTIGDKTVDENSPLSFTVTTTDADGDTIRYSAQNLPSGATFAGQTFNWMPDYNQAGSYQVTFITSDGNAQDSKTITITVNNVNRAPVLSKIGDKSVYTNNLLTFDINVTDPDGNTVTYSATGLPIGATFAGQSFRWTPAPNQAGTYHVTFIASDGRLQDSETITIIVYSTDTSAPTVSGLSPAADSIQMPLDRLVILHVADNGEGVDANSLTIKVSDNIVYTGDTADYNSSYGRCHRTGAKADYTFIYQPNTAFDYDHKVSVVVNAQDLAGNAMSQYSYSFVTKTRSFGENKMVNSSSKNIGKGHPAAVRDIAGNIWVAWHAGPMSSSGMKRGIYVGKLPAGADNFGTNVREANNSSDRCNAALAIDAYDKLYLVWQDNRRKKWDIYISTSVDGINWSTETRVTDSDNNAVNLVIAVDHSLPPKAYIAWQDDRAGNQEIYIASSNDGFATETISRITSDSSDHIKPAIAVDSANTVYVVWADSRNGSSDIYGAASNSGPWANVPIVTNPGNQTNPAIATEATGAILHLLWVDDTAGNKDIYYAASNGLPETSLAGRNIVDDNSGADQLTPVIITIGSTGAGLRVFACWQDMRNIVKSGNTDLYFVEVNHGKETNIFVGNNATSSNQSAPVIGVDRYGYPYLVWVDGRNQNTDIYYAGSTFVHSNTLASQNVSPASDAIIGTEPANITGVDDVSVVVPAGAYPCELDITISKVENPPKFPVSLFTFPYEFGPSGANFNQPVTITIPYSVSASNNSAFAYWYNKLADALSQQGITNVETIAISPTLYAIRFKTTHFSQFIVGGNVKQHTSYQIHYHSRQQEQ